ncbi:hypothetical protein MKX03_033223 [Papaver bracteatum]|nr:hypothetical protein MKX03_033223 [Papaver bracteatum]
MRKKLDTRFPASRIKKIMQADEDVGKIALAVPLLVSKALELFLQDLCDRTYDLTLRRGAKTMSSLHLKQCVQSFNVFDFLKEIVSKVPDFGGSDAGGEDRAHKRRKTVVDEDNDSEEEGKRNRISHETGHNSSSGRGRGRSRGRGRGRGRPPVDRESSRLEKCEGDPDMSPQHDNQNPETISPDNGIEPRESADNMTTIGSTSDTEIRNFDLNVVLDDSGANQLVRSDSGTAAAASATAAPSAIAASTSAEPPPEIKQHEEYPGWSVSDMDKMSIDPLQLAQLNSKRLDEEEDYDEEEE